MPNQKTTAKKIFHKRCRELNPHPIDLRSITLTNQPDTGLVYYHIFRIRGHQYIQAIVISNANAQTAESMVPCSNHLRQLATAKGLPALIATILHLVISVNPMATLLLQTGDY